LLYHNHCGRSIQLYSGHFVMGKRIWRISRPTDENAKPMWLLKTAKCIFLLDNMKFYMESTCDFYSII